ncbi:hypothetical protein J1N35_041365 [Gossypium stocksii]|uniref:DDE Tnp4 domain-containing protein n=1 Tax=Gossypium stocksii TaxID=47602 RepID=A0A9D3UFP9_9ROSI|nr:hypothetical protein J1N35_041365 [Gossypium stocksii]
MDGSGLRNLWLVWFTLFGSTIVIRLPDESTPSEIRNNPRFYPYFKDCIRALDGTHVRASVPLSIQGRFHSRKRGTTQNVLAIITFDLKFSYVLAGWEGSAHDYRILSDALLIPRGSRILEGKYYLANARYGIQNGYITPYCGVRYHLKEFSAKRPENAKELFNLHHSSLRITIERVFGILKKRFCVLDAEQFWNFQTQSEKKEKKQVNGLLRKMKLHKLCGLIIWLEILGRMGKGNKERTSKQFRWTKSMKHLFLEILVEEVQKGNKPSNTFKAVSINQFVVAISKRFQVQCDMKHVENHLRIVKNQWQIICTIRAKSSFGWDDNMKMITCDRATYDAVVMTHKKYEPFLNKSINQYDEIALVVGKDMATGSFARTFANIDLDNGNQDSIPINCDNKETEEADIKVDTIELSSEEQMFQYNRGQTWVDITGNGHGPSSATVAANVGAEAKVESPTTRLCGGYTGLLQNSYYDVPGMSMGRHSLVFDRSTFSHCCEYSLVFGMDLNFNGYYQSGYESNSNLDTLDIQSVHSISILVDQFPGVKVLIPRVSTYTNHQSSADFVEHMRYRRTDYLLSVIDLTRVPMKPEPYGSDDNYSNNVADSTILFRAYELSPYMTNTDLSAEGGLEFW